MIASSATLRKLATISVATGRWPASAAPTAAPTKLISQIGVSITRSAPNWRIRPLVAPVGSPQASMMPWAARPAPPATSSPITNTRSSRSISWRSASFSARPKASWRPATLHLLPRGRVDVRGQLGQVRQGALLGEADRAGDGRLHVGDDPLQVAGRQHAQVGHGLLVALDAVAAAIVRLFVGRTVA